MSEKIPMRTCMGCRQTRAKKDLIRVVRDLNGAVTVDSMKNMNGRGVYVCSDEKCIGLVRKKNALARSLKTSVPENIYEELLKEALQ